MEPTKEQSKEFWERCGFKYDDWLGWIYPDGNNYDDAPPLDLNNLFKYAVPKLTSVYLTEKYGELATAEARMGTVSSIISCGDPALALFWAIYKVIK